MRRVLCIAGMLCCVTSSAHAEKPLPKPLVTGLKNPASVAVGVDERIYITEMGEPGKDGDGQVLVLDNGKPVPFATGLDDPRGIVAFQQWLFVADKQRVWRIDKKGKAEVFAAAGAFPTPPVVLSGITVDEEGTIYVSDLGGGEIVGTIYRIDQKGKVTLLTNNKHTPALRLPTGLAMDGMSHLLVVDAYSGELLRIKNSDKSTAKLADAFSRGASLTWDYFGRLYIGDWNGGRIFVIARPGDKPVEIASGFKSPASLALDPTGKFILVVDEKAGTVTALPATVSGQEVDETPLPLEAVVAFPDLQWTGWKGQSEGGKVTPLRPVVLTHAGDGSDRVFVGTEHGVIHVFPNDQKATKTKVFLDIQDRVVYNDDQNEEGFLGLVFHPDYKKNGEFFVFYTTKKAKLTNVVSRFRVSKDDPDKADPNSEEVLMEIKKPYWNHDGGTLCFGADGYLYITHGDGGLANDPHNNGQNLKTMLGKVLRIDVDHKDKDKPYAIPKDNPFVTKEGALPEIYAYGLRNIWRMAFDRKTGKLWAADVGQNLYEEIDHIVAGGNYGWNLREGLHPFGAQGVGPRKDLIEPIWEYHHDVGKSLTGGLVYRGKRLPELEGAYVYGDYVTSRIWALRYDDDKKRVTENHPIRKTTVPIMSFGEDEKGEIYFMTYSPNGKGIYWFVKTDAGKR
jgi:glucose/arabinose dehydrogenase/sugar lactone lactonase YvrE